MALASYRNEAVEYLKKGYSDEDALQCTILDRNRRSYQGYLRNKEWNNRVDRNNARSRLLDKLRNSDSEFGRDLRKFIETSE
jgi:hypothetical protein